MGIADRYRQIVELSHDCIKEIGLDGSVQAINENGLKAVGASTPTQLIGQRWRDFWPSESAPLIDEAVAASARGLVQEFEAACVNFRGVRQTWHVITSPLRDSQGNVEAVLAVSRDVSERRAMEVALESLRSSLSIEMMRTTQALRQMRAREGVLAEELHELADENARVQGDLDIAKAAQQAAELIAEQAQKGEAVGQLLAGVVHDLNNVLQTASSAIDFALQGSDITARTTKLLMVAESALQHGAVMAQRLVGFSRKHPYRPEPTDIGQVAKDMEPLLKQAIGSGLRLVVDTNVGESMVVVDRHTVERALMNLVINARDASKSGGVIRVTTGSTSVASEHSTLDRASGNYQTLSVADDGHGMDEQVMSRLFEAYFTTKADGKGSGLGLAQVYGTVRQAGGFIDVTSTVGAGSRFELAFPV